MESINELIRIIIIELLFIIIVYVKLNTLDDDENSYI